MNDPIWEETKNAERERTPDGKLTQGAFVTLVNERREKAIAWLVSNKGLSHTEAEEVWTSVYVNLVEKSECKLPAKYDMSESTVSHGAQIMKLILNKISDHWRKYKSQAGTRAGYADECQIVSTPSQIESDEDAKLWVSVATGLSCEILRWDVRTATDHPPAGLTPKEHLVWTMRVQRRENEHWAVEVAAELGWTPDRVYYCLRGANRKLRDEIHARMARVERGCAGGEYA